MKEFAAQSDLANIRRRESSRSLGSDSSSSCSSPASSFNSPPIPRRASTSALKTARSQDQSPIQEEEEEVAGKSLRKTLTRKLSSFIEAESPHSGWSGMGSLSSLKGSLGLSPGKRVNKDTEEEEAGNTLKKRLSRRLSSIFDGVSQISEAGFFSSSSSSSPSPTTDTTTSIMEARLVKRGDLPICWLDMMASSTSTKRANVPNSDLLTRLASRVYTRHLARQVLRLLSKQDLLAMRAVCSSWRSLCHQEIASGEA